MSRDADLRLRAYVLAVVVVSAVCLAATVRVRPLVGSPVLFALVAAAMLAGSLAVRLSSVNVSITSAISAAGVLLLGPAAGSVISGLSSLPASFRAEDRRWTRGAFNLGQLALADLAGGWAYVLAGGRPLAGAPLGLGEIPSVILPLFLLAATSFLINTTLVGTVVTLSTGVPMKEVWRSSFGWTIPTQAALVVLALALAQVVASEGIVGLGLFIMPLLIARQFYERYVTLRSAYAETVRSLVAVIEAKDTYTRGHSERVAAYATDIGRRLGFSNQRAERIELAALLHDLGKVAVSREVLAKAGRLSDQEYEAVKKHPAVGADIIESVPFLADLAPFISSHHERIDGNGYGNGLLGDEIPLEARVLSVADAFDAMTSSRPYRPALTVEETISELRRCSGSQFDQVIVETFAEALERDGLPVALPPRSLDEVV